MGYRVLVRTLSSPWHALSFCALVCVEYESFCALSCFGSCGAPSKFDVGDDDDVVVEGDRGSIRQGKKKQMKKKVRTSLIRWVH